MPFLVVVMSAQNIFDFEYIKTNNKISLFFIYFNGDIMKIIAHRANNNHKYKENTIEGIIDSLNKDYIDGVEFDIRLTKDKYFVLYHNATYKDNLIKNKYLKDLKLDELNNVLKNIKSNKIILIDIKCEEGNYKEMSDYLIKVLKKYKKLNIYLCSFNYEMCLYLKEKTKYKVGLLISNLINKNKNIKPFDFISINYKIYKDINKDTFVWTINKKELFKKFLNKKVYIITDKAYLILEK